jgi:membrane protein implicated in regulation of membrane protease activity
MEWLFGWYNVIFYIPILIGFAMVLGSAFGFVDHDVAVDTDIHVDIHVDHDVGHGHSGDGHGGGGLFSWLLLGLGIGRAPITIVFMVGMLLFGGLGAISNIFLRPLIEVSSIFALISFGIALIGGFFLTGFFARMIARFIPSVESYNIKIEQLAGCTGTTVVTVDEKSGVVDINDHEDHPHRVMCRVRSGTIPKGTNVVAIEYFADENRFLVEKYELNC